MELRHHRLWHTIWEHATHWTVAGALLAATGAAPEHWVADLIHHVPLLYESLPSWAASVDYRFIAVIAGLTIIVGDTVWRNHRRREPVVVAASPAGNGGEAGMTPLIIEPNNPPMPPIRYCSASDGVHLAYMVHGEGPSLVMAGHWLSHLQLDWENPIRRGYFDRLGQGRTLLRYDARGTGLSDRRPETISPSTWLSDLETVVDAAGLDRFALFGLSQTASVAIRYAALHPDRVTKLIIYGGYARGWKHRSDVDLEEQRAVIKLTQLGWDRDNPAFRQMFTTEFMPDATKEAFDSFTELGRRYTSGEAVARYLEAIGDVNVVSELPKISTPTLVLHVREERRQPFELGREIAAGIPGARLIALPGRNHVLQSHEPAEEQLLDEIDRFLRS